jgi:hypothetical protein
MKYHASWSPQAIEIFEKTITAHGGWSAWDQVSQVKLHLKEFRGLLPWLKGLGKTFFAPIEMTIDPKRRQVEFDYGAHKDRFQNGELIFSPEKKHVLDGRQIFTKSVLEKWWPQHALYFFGYAWANYLSYPFILPQFELIAWTSTSSSSWFKIRFPESFHTHSRVQSFYFDSQNLLARHNYHADYAGSIFYGAHFTEGYQSYDGLQIACIRKVQPRIGNLALPLYGIYARLGI